MRGPDVGLNPGVVADEDDTLPLDRDRTGPGPRGVDRIDWAVAEDDVGASVLGGDRLGDIGRSRRGGGCGRGGEDCAAPQRLTARQAA